MSDFDREAERERLRKKYEQDKKEREATERMSELLLQGATMTNAHCSECGDPIFRYDGQEFCATCERPVDREGEADAESEEDADGQTGVEVTAPSDDTRVVFGDDGEGQPDATTQQGHSETGDRPQETTGPGDQRTDPETVEAPATHTGEAPAAHTGEATRRSDDTTAAGGAGERRDDSASGVEAARASLVRTLAAFSQRAEATDDPQRAREHLQAAREAAEALAALRG